MARRLFCNISPTTYRISVCKEKINRDFKNIVLNENIAKSKTSVHLPIIISKHKSLIKRKLGNVDLQLQENKAVNLKIAAPRINGIIIKPQQTFSFWSLIGSCTKRKGYQDGLLISNGETGKGIGGGMCQLSNLIHWLVLHSPMDVVEHHNHNNIDLFPDYNRQVPFGVGTSVMHNYLDYRFKNNTNASFQLIVYIDEEYLCGELLSDTVFSYKYHITVENEYFSNENETYYRNNQIVRNCIDKKTGNTIKSEVIMRNHAKVMYDKSFIVDLNNTD